MQIGGGAGWGGGGAGVNYNLTFFTRFKFFLILKYIELMMHKIITCQASKIMCYIIWSFNSHEYFKHNFSLFDHILFNLPMNFIM